MSETGREFVVTADDGVELHGEEHGTGSALVLLHGGGDRVAFRPLARRLAVGHRVLLPDIRGYGRSVCRDPAAHTWARYVADVRVVLRALAEPRGVVVGAGLGATIALRLAVAEPALVTAAAVISPEDVEDDEAKAAETVLMDRFAVTVTEHGLDSAWQLFLPDLQPLIGTIVREAIPRADPASSAAAAAIGRDRAFGDVTELAAIRCPVLVVAGSDPRHPTDVARRIAETVPRGRRAAATFGPDLRTVEELADAVAPEILALTAEVSGQSD